MATLTSWMFFLQNAGSFFGIYIFAAFSERYGRRPAFFLWFALAWVSVLAYFWGLRGSGEGAFARALILAPIMGFCTLGPFSGYTVYFPYLYPTRLRATGCGFCYNVARYLVPIGPLAIGQLAVSMGGFAPAATVISFIYVFGFIGTWLGPETKGRPLPEDADFDVKPKPVQEPAGAPPPSPKEFFGDKNG
jgi:MFS family permease